TKGARPSRSRSGSSRSSLSVDDDVADAVAGVHVVEGAVDLVEPERVRDHLLHLDESAHVPVDVLWQLGAPARAAEGGAAPGAAGHEQERPGVDLLARPGDTDDDRLAPAFVRRGERLPHHLDVADALEGE